MHGPEKNREVTFTDNIGIVIYTYMKLDSFRHDIMELDMIHIV